MDQFSNSDRGERGFSLADLDDLFEEAGYVELLPLCLDDNTESRITPKTAESMAGYG